ncbi:MAG: hypothetical protein WCJ89_03915 [Actinomycetes bacterium]
MLRNHKRSPWAIVLGLSLALSASSSFGSEGNQSSGNERSNPANWTQPQNDSQYWGNPTRVIASDRDQADLDSQAGAVPGLTVAPAKVFEMRNVAKVAATATSLGSGDLLDRHGALLPTITIHPIYWGPSSTLNVSYQLNTTNFLSGLVCSNCSTRLAGMLKQYSRGANINISLGKSYSDTSNPPSNAPATNAVANEVVKVVSAGAKDPIDPTGLYLVFTSNFPSRAGYCAYHGAASVRIASTTTSFTFGYMPNLASQLNGCGAQYLPNYVASGVGQAFDSLFNVTTHELYETITDPGTSGYAWYDASGYEIGDKCAWNWSTSIAAAGKTYVVQQEYSNLTHSCAVS